jgi:hypothetical protein
VTKRAIVATGVLVVLIVGGIVYLLMNRGPKILGSVGNPPIFVSDGSLHAHSKVRGWDPDKEGDTKFQALPKNGSLSRTCGMIDDNGNSASAIFLENDDNKVQNIEPNTNSNLEITVIYAGSNANDGNAAVDVTVPDQAGALTVLTVLDYFHKSSGKGDRLHSRNGNVQKITIVGHGNDSIVWVPQGATPRFTIGFCYK